MFYYIMIGFAFAFLGERFKVGFYFLAAGAAFIGYVLTAPGTLVSPMRILLIACIAFLFIRGLTLKNDVTEEKRNERR